MADFDLEQLKTIMENLGDRLDRTKGDQLSRDELFRIRAVLTKMSNGISKGNAGQDQNTIINDLVKEMRKANPRGSGANPTPKRGTIIEEEKAKRRGNTDGNTILDQLLRKAGSEANDFSDALDYAGKNTKTFSERLVTANAAFASATASAKGFLAKVLPVGAERVDFYRDLLASGEGTVTSMQDMGRQASAAGMTVEQFVNAMKDGTQGARQLGAIKFGEVRKSLLEMTRASGYMGMLPDQITDVTSTYAEILRNQGAGKDRSTEQMAAGILNLVKTGETTAHILGQTREEALEAQKLASADFQFQGAAKAQGFDAVSAEAVRAIFKNNFGDIGVQAITDQLTFGQVVNKSASELAATNPDLQRTLSLAETMLKSGASSDQIQMAVAESLKQSGANAINNKDQLRIQSQIAQLEGNSLAGAMRANLQNTFLSQGLNTDPNFNRGSDQNQNDEQRAGVGILQIEESLKQIAVTMDTGITAIFNPLVDMWGPTMRDELLPNLDAFNKGLQESLISLSTNTSLMGGIGTTALAVAGGLALFGGALGLAVKGLGAFRALGAMRGALGGLGGAGGAGAGGAGGAGAAGAGGLMGLLKSGGKMAGKAGILGGAIEAGSYIFGDKELSFENLARSGLSLGGGAIGSLFGSALGPVGTFVGGTGGYMAGSSLGDYIFGEEKSNAQTGTPQNARTGSATPQMRQDANVGANANATGQKSKQSLTTDQMTNKIMDASERSAMLLKQIKDNSDKHLEATREEIAVIRAMGDRLGRLLQEGNRNTKSIVENSV